MSKATPADFIVSRLAVIIATLGMLLGSVLCYVWADAVTDTQSSVASALAAAFLSVAVALLVTELILKPVFARDVLRAAGLKQRLAEIGIQDVMPSHSLPWQLLFASSTNISVVVTRPESWKTSQWPTILDAATARAAVVTVYLPDPAPSAPGVRAVAEVVADNLGLDAATYSAEVRAVAADLERAWKSRAAGGVRKLKEGSVLTIKYLSAPPQHGLTRFDDQTVVTLHPLIPDRSTTDLAVHISKPSDAVMNAWIDGSEEALAGASDPVPVWTSLALSRGEADGA